MANNCKVNLQRSVEWCQGQTSLPGIKRRIFYISKNDIVDWPALPITKAGRIDTPTYTDDFTLSADVTWKFIDVLPDKCQVTSEPQGEYPSQTQLNKLVAVHPGVGPAATMLAAYVNNDDCVFLVETPEGLFRVLGCEAYQTKCTVNQDLGQGSTGSTSTTINVEVTDVIPAPFYFGKIKTADGDVQSKAWEGGLLEDDTE